MMTISDFLAELDVPRHKDPLRKNKAVLRQYLEAKRIEALARNNQTPIEHTRAFREGRLTKETLDHA